MLMFKEHASKFLQFDQEVDDDELDIKKIAKKIVHEIKSEKTDNKSYLLHQKVSAQL